jgi:hypothetical protein
LGTSYHCAGRVYAELNQPAAAVEALRQAVEIRESLCRQVPNKPALQTDVAGTRRRLEAAERQLKSPQAAGPGLR